MNPSATSDFAVTSHRMMNPDEKLSINHLSHDDIPSLEGDKTPDNNDFDLGIDRTATHSLTRGLKSRHIQFLAIGGAIGTGLFIGSGAVLSLVGPAPLFMSYLCMMALVWTVMNCLAEMAAYIPLKGISVPYLVDRFVDPSLSFAVGWNYWYAYAILVAAEATAGGIILQYWTDQVNVGVWIAMILIVILVLNIVAVEVFGEAEFWFASIKLITILGLCIVGVVLFFGGGPNHDRLGFRYWEDKNGYSAFKPYLVDGNTGNFLAFWIAFIRSGYSFVTSPELVVLGAGECIAPRRNIPKAASRFIYRLAVFYGMGSLVIGVIVPRNDDRLLSPNSNASASPFVIGIQRAGIQGLNHVINAAILTSAWSAGNAFVFSGSRVLHSLALTGQAPGIFKKTTKFGVPWTAVLATWLIGCLAFLNVSNSGATVFTWFSNISTISGYIAWILCLICYLRFRKAMAWNHMLSALPYRTFWNNAHWPAAFALLLFILLTLTNGFNVFFPSEWSVSDFLAAYITIPIFLALYIGHKLYMTTNIVLNNGPGEKSLVKAWLSALTLAKPIAEIDVMTGKLEMDKLEEMDVPPVPKNLLERIWFWVA